jgi:hypothetical protein
MMLILLGDDIAGRVSLRSWYILDVFFHAALETDIE